MPVMKIFAFLAAFLILAWPCGAFAVSQSERPFKVQIVSLTDTTGVAGTIEGKETAEARARIGGTLEDVKVERGAWVKKGQVLAVVQDKKLPQQTAALKIQVEAAAKNVARLRELLPLDAASPAEVEQAEAQLSALKAQAENTTQNTEDGRILAPFDGQFVALKVVKGSVMMPGESLGTVAAQPLRIKLALPERHANMLNVGDNIPLTNDLGEDMGTGQIERIYPQVANGRVTVDVSIPSVTSKLRVGQKIVALVATGSREGVLVPKAYISIRNNLVFVRLKTGGDVLVQVATSPQAGMVEVLSGLKAGDEIVRP